LKVFRTCSYSPLEWLRLSFDEPHFGQVKAEALGGVGELVIIKISGMNKKLAYRLAKYYSLIGHPIFLQMFFTPRLKMQ
jgi:hypothetical protein